MFFDKQNGKPVHEKAHMYAKEYADGQLSRREFLVRATALGVSATTAYALIGQNAAEASVSWTNPPKMGGTLRCQMEVRPHFHLTAKCATHFWRVRPADRCFSCILAYQGVCSCS